MPGTDMCIKIGGWVRAEITNEANGNLAWGPFNGNLNTRNTNNITERARGYITADAREQTAYGVARAYIDVGINSSDAGNTGTGGSLGSPASAGFANYTNRAFVQWAGFTAGLAQSFFDFYPAAALNYRAGYLPQEDYRRRRLVGMGLHRPVRRRLLRHAVGGKPAHDPDRRPKRSGRVLCSARRQCGRRTAQRQPADVIAGLGTGG